MDDPTRHLVDPGDPQPAINDGYADPFDMFSIISPTHWINALVAEITGWDAIGWITESFTGEWNAYATCGLAFKNLAACLQDIGINIQRAAIDVDHSWDGNASDAAYMYFSNVASTVSGAQAVLHDAAENYGRAARGIWTFANQISGILEAIVDSAILAGVTAASGTALIATGIGAFVGYGLAAMETARIIDLIGRAGKIIQTAGTLILGIAGAIMGLVSQGGDLSRIQLPGAAYDHPAVA